MSSIENTHRQPLPGTDAHGADDLVTLEVSSELAKREIGPDESSPQASKPSPRQAPAEVNPDPLSPRRQRRVVLPLVLFLLTCVSTFLAGATDWIPLAFLEDSFTLPVALGLDAEPYLFLPYRVAVLSNWGDGLIYMACVLAILLFHEMGHFVMTVVYRVRASFPYFIPVPFISPIGTMGAVIGMDGLKANRRQIFDIGLAGPLAGLVVAVPIVWLGISRLDLEHASGGPSLQLPLAMRLLVDQMHPGEYKPEIGVPLSQANPYFMAGWVGLLVTGLNMLPVSQLDGGHVTYALFGRGAHWIARIFMLVAFAYIGSMLWHYRQPTWLLMALLVLLIGTDHPPTSDDRVKLGPFRTALGLASLLIPVLCFVPNLRF